MNACVVLGYQSQEQIAALYGDDEAWAIQDACGNTLDLSCGHLKLASHARALQVNFPTDRRDFPSRG